MAEFIADRGDSVLIAMRVPRDLWNRYEYRHKHYGKAIHSLRGVVCDILAAHSAAAPEYVDKGDPFYRGPQ